MVKRRNFLSRIGIAGMALMTQPFQSLSKTLKQNQSKMSDSKNVIKQIKPLGFQWETKDPFLFCVHHEDKFPKGNTLMGPDKEYFKGRHMGDDFIIKDGFRMYHGKTVPGFPGHPHRGFETITLVREGYVDHSDSMGAAGRYGNGDVQWMTAGSGVQHAEMFPLLSEDKENPMELFQIWLNLPKKSKMVKPYFKMMWREDIPKYSCQDSNGYKTTVEVIAGNLYGTSAPTPPPDSWAADVKNEVGVWNIKMSSNSSFILPKASATVNRMLYFYQGNELNVSGKKIDSYSSVELLANEEILLSAGNTDTGILILQGKPIAETVIQYGPFVMNSKEEIHQAFEDYHKTQFGGWPWPKYDVVHPKAKGRFAKYADGKEEIKGV